MKKEVNGWQIKSFEYGFTYSGLMAGKPIEKTNNSIIEHKIRKILTLDLGFDEPDINISKDYSGYFGGTKDYDKNEFALKPVMCFFSIFKHDPEQIAAYVLTFADETESPEDVIERITKKENLKMVEWDY